MIYQKAVYATFILCGVTNGIQSAYGIPGFDVATGAPKRKNYLWK